MEKVKVLYVTHEITPYLPDTHMSKICRNLPQVIQETGKEIRTFMPRFGCINERRNQLHEVIRLSGMNLIICNSDHPLIIKVASIPTARMQVYFIENEDYFQRKFLFKDKNNKFYDDNDERSVFFNRGVIETVKKLGWAPNVVHIHGWMSLLTAFYIKTAFKDNPIFFESKIIVSLYNDFFDNKFSDNFYQKIKTADINDDDVSVVKSENNYLGLMKMCLQFADGVIIAEDGIQQDILNYVKQKNIPVLKHKDENYTDAYHKFYNKICMNEEVLS